MGLTLALAVFVVPRSRVYHTRYGCLVLAECVRLSERAAWIGGSRPCRRCWGRGRAKWRERELRLEMGDWGNAT